jgi:hypothetical protein
VQRLRVMAATHDDVYRDLVRCAERFRQDEAGVLIREGTVCKITVADRSSLCLIRGVRGIGDDSSLSRIYVDERLRDDLGLTLGEEREFRFATVRFGGFWWAWGSSNPAYRVMAQLAVLSVVLGGLRLLAGILGLVASLRPSAVQ